MTYNYNLVTKFKLISKLQVYVHIEKRTFMIEVIEMEDTEDTSDITIHKTPVIELLSEVIPRETQVVVKGTGINLKLRKDIKSIWPKFSPSTYSWIKFDFDSVHDDAEVTSNETPPENPLEVDYDYKSPPRAQCEFNVESSEDSSGDSSDEEGENENVAEDWKDMYL